MTIMDMITDFPFMIYKKADDFSVISPEILTPQHVTCS